MNIELQNIFSALRSNFKKNDFENSKIIYQEKKDIKIELDKKFNDIICRYLSSQYKYPILSEESNNMLDFREYDNYVWILDPLDGSLNHSRRIPLSCISISLWKKSIPIIGIIYDFNADIFYFTGTDGFFYVNDHICEVSSVQSVNDGVICTGFPSWRNYETESLNKFVNKIQKWKKVRLLGSAALSLAWVASGKVDAYFEEDIRIWDVAAGLALVQAAGGDILIQPSKRSNFVTAVATNGKIKIDEVLS